jgi:hypothetical protein
MFYMTYPAAEISHGKLLTTSTTKVLLYSFVQDFTIVFKIKHKLYILTVSTPFKK